MNFLALIEHKRDGKPLTEQEIKAVITAYTAGKIPDYQMAAFLMATYFRGLDHTETAALTLAMRDSGDSLIFPEDPRPLVDKHSTGGVGDKVSLPLAPLLACLGFRVPMISGRGLGITGGTLDKLDSIPGFKTALPKERIIEIVQEVGCVICGQTERMVPADRSMYALRDVTGTVPSIPLIVASILSKKLAENLSALVLDVKFGAAAFMSSIEQARQLAQTMVALGNRCGVKTRALLTSMDSPLGCAAGNWLEVKEAVTCLETKTDNAGDLADLVHLVVECAAHLLVQTDRCPDLQQAREKASDCFNSGEPRRKWDQMLVAQGADRSAFNEKLRRAHTAPVVLDVKAPASGSVSAWNARVVGEIVRDLGGGRLTKDSVLDYDAGIEIVARTGRQIHSLLARVHAGDRTKAEEAAARLTQACTISKQAPAPPPLIAEVIQ